MQVRQIFFFTVGLIFLFLPKDAFSQKVTLNENGEKIVVYPDGSWHFFKDVGMDSTGVSIDLPVNNPIAEAPKVKKKKKKKNKKKKKSKGKKAKKSGKVDLAFEESERRKAVQRAERAATIEETARLSEEESVFKRIFLEDELEEAYHSIDMTHEDIAEIEVRLKKAKEEEAIAKSSYETAQDRSKLYEKMIGMSSGKRLKLLAKTKGDMPSPLEDETIDSEEITAVVSIGDVTVIPNPIDDLQQESYAETPVNVVRPRIRTYDPNTNLLRFPPAHPCQLSYNDVDAFSGKKRKQTQKTFFFAHTPDRFRSYFKGRDYLVCSGTLIAINGTPRTLSIEYIIATDQAAREFGILEKGSQLILRLIDGGRIILVNNKTATGIADPVTKTTTYTTTYPLNKGQLKSLKDAEVDKVRMIWATGYEDYEVYQVDFFKDLFRCLDEG